MSFEVYLTAVSVSFKFFRRVSKQMTAFQIRNDDELEMVG